MNVSTPTFGSPMAFSIPAGVSHMRGGGLPLLDFRAIPFTMIAPILLRSQYLDISSPYPAVPDASITGLRSFIPAMSADKSGFIRKYQPSPLPSHSGRG